MNEHKNFNANDLTGCTEIIGVLINTENNLDVLDTMPNRPYLDLSLIYKFRLKNTYLGFANEYIPITYLVMEQMGLTEAELYRAALCNMGRVLITEIGKVIENLSDGAIRAQPNEEPKMFVVSNDNGTFGAANLIRPVIFQLIADRYNADLYIIPSSIHELIVVVKDPYVELDDSINSMIHSVNENEVPYGSVLADHAYLYTRNTNSISILEG